MKNIKSDIKKSIMITKDFYLSESSYKNVINKVFNNSWQLITDTKSLGKIKQYPFYFLSNSINEPMILIKQNDIKCISNVCTHRAHLLVNNNCNKKNIKCKYHGRTFNLDGSLNHAPGFEDLENFPSKEDNLIDFDLLKWENFIFCGINPIINLQPIFDDINKRLPAFKFRELNYDKNNSQTFILNAHWALYCENYLEGFHVPFVHKGLNQDINYDTYETILLENGVLQIANSSKKHESIDKTDNIYAFYYWLFPNLMINIYHWGISINIIEPINKSKTKIKFLSYPLEGKSQPKNSHSSLDKVELEDQEVVLNVQNGIQSKSYSGVKFSPKYEQGLQHFHSILSKYL
tara:strand:- start:8398 stop:9441 length:1044 start_codon:yes stop_codon:yes gene_type:complete